VLYSCHTGSIVTSPKGVAIRETAKGQIMNGAMEKQHAHELIERLPDSEIATAIRFLELMLLDPVARWRPHRPTMSL